MKNKYWIVCLLAAILLSVLPVGTVADDHEKPIYLALGDSISTGFGLENAENEGFAPLVATELNFSLVNEAVDGSTSHDVLAKLADGISNDAIRQAKLITVTCGGNDMMHALYSEIVRLHNAKNETVYTVEEVKTILADSSMASMALMDTAIEALAGFTDSEAFQVALTEYETAMFGQGGVIETLRSLNATSPILVMTQYNPYQSFKTLLSDINVRFDAGAQVLNEVIAAHALLKNYSVLDVYGIFKNVDTDNLCNASAVLGKINLDFHPNAKGHALIAKSVVKAYGLQDFGFAGYQTGNGGIRLVGYLNALKYESVDLNVTVTGDAQVTISAPCNVVYTALMGTVDGEVKPVATCDPTVDAAYQMDYAYLYGVSVTDLAPGDYTVVIQPTAHYGGTVLLVNAVTLSLTVQEDGGVLVSDYEKIESIS